MCFTDYSNERIDRLHKLCDDLINEPYRMGNLDFRLLATDEFQFNLSFPLRFNYSMIHFDKRNILTALLIYSLYTSFRLQDNGEKSCQYLDGYI